MAIDKLGHYSIRTPDLAASAHFYVEVLGLRPGFRPAFDFPGMWLYLPDSDADYGVVHLIGTDEGGETGLADYLGDRKDAADFGSAAVDHMAFLARDWPDFERRIRASGVDHRVREVPMLGLKQVFLEDPSGVTIELNFPAEEAVSAPARQATGAGK